MPQGAQLEEQLTIIYGLQWPAELEAAAGQAKQKATKAVRKP